MIRDEPYMNMLYMLSYNIVVPTATEVTSITVPLSLDLTFSYVQVGVATSDAEMCTDTVYCVDVYEAGDDMWDQCMQSRNISLHQNLNVCQSNYTVVGYAMDDPSKYKTYSEFVVPDGKVK